MFGLRRVHQSLFHEILDLAVVPGELFERAVAQDPGFARAHAGLSFVHFQTAFMGQAADPAKEMALSRSYAQRGLDLDPQDGDIIAVAGPSTPLPNPAPWRSSR